MIPTEEDHWSWSHFCLTALGCEHKNYKNFAIPGGGNMAAMTNLIYFLETNPDWTPENTRIGFNITGLDRQDAIVSAEHAKALAMRAQYHIREDLQIGWLINSVHPDSRLHTKQQQIQTCLAVTQALTYLDYRGFDYFFMLLNQSIYNFSPQWFQQALDQHQYRWLHFDAGGMYERVKSAGLIDSTKHPTRAGYQLLADDVLEYLESR
jgi:hypothetical protein